MGLMIIFSIIQTFVGIIIILLIESRIFAKLRCKNCCNSAKIGEIPDKSFLNEVLRLFSFLNFNFQKKINCLKIKKKLDADVLAEYKRIENSDLKSLSSNEPVKILISLYLNHFKKRFH